MAKEIASPGELMEMVNAFRISKIILSAYELGIFTILKDGALTSIEVADAMRMSRRSTDRFMNALVSLGLLKKNKWTILRNTAFSLKYLVKGNQLILQDYPTRFISGKHGAPSLRR